MTFPSTEEVLGRKAVGTGVEEHRSRIRDAEVWCLFCFLLSVMVVG